MISIALSPNVELGISLHILEQNLLAAAVIKLRSPAVGVAGNALSGFKSAVVFQKIRNTGRPEAAGAITCPCFR
jgi:hypothetical protein